MMALKSPPDEVYAKSMEVEVDREMTDTARATTTDEHIHDGNDTSGDNDDHINQNEGSEEEEEKEGASTNKQEDHNSREQCDNCDSYEETMFLFGGRGTGSRGAGGHGGRGTFCGRGTGDRGVFGGRGGADCGFGGRGFPEGTEEFGDDWEDPRMAFEGIGSRGGRGRGYFGGRGGSSWGYGSRGGGTEPDFCADPRMSFEGMRGGRGGGRGGAMFDRRLEHSRDGSFFARPCMAHGNERNAGGVKVGVKENSKDHKTKDTEAKKQKQMSTDEEHDSENNRQDNNAPPCTCNVRSDMFGARGGRGRGGWGRGGRGGFRHDPTSYFPCRGGWQGLGARAPFARSHHFSVGHDSPSVTFGISFSPAVGVRPPFPPHANLCRPRPLFRPEQGLVW